MAKSLEKFDVTYFIISHGSQTSGVFKKIRDQMNEWERNSLNFQAWVITDEVGFQDWKSITKQSQVFIDPSGPCKLIYRSILFMKAVRSSREIVYVREVFPLLYFQLKSRPRLILEVQTLQNMEVRIRSKYKWIIFTILEKFWIKNFSSFVFVSKELKILLSKRWYRKPGFVISNGINLNRYQTLKDVDQYTHPNFFFIGSLTQPWQGTEQLFDLARVMPQSIFNIVGEATIIDGAPPNLQFHGVLPEEQYIEIAQKCSVAFGTLNQQLTDMTEASPLKVREYLALGLPVIGRYLDSDLSNRCDFYLELPCNNQPLTDFKNEITDFVSKWHGQRVPREQVQDLISGVQKEADRLKIFNEIISRNVRNQAE